MSTEHNLAKLKAAYAAWNDHKGASLDVFRELMDENIRLTNWGEEADALPFAAAPRGSREAALQYLGEILNDWTMIHYTPQQFVCEGDHIAMFGTCAWTNKATGKQAACKVAGLWRFKDGKAVEFTDMFDTAVAAAAATP
jgi:ketosteroid isomerase-like protein